MTNLCNCEQCQVRDMVFGADPSEETKIKGVHVLAYVLGNALVEFDDASVLEMIKLITLTRITRIGAVPGKASVDLLNVEVVGHG